MEHLKFLRVEIDFFLNKNLKTCIYSFRETNKSPAMPLYEGIGLISEKHAVVLDIGWDTTKCGYAGEVSPRCIIPSKVDNTRILDTTDPDKLYALLVDFVHHLYFKWLLVNPKDRRVVIVENILGSSLFKDTLVKVLFRHYEVSSVLCAPSHLVSLFSLGVNTGACGNSFCSDLEYKID